MLFSIWMFLKNILLVKGSVRHFIIRASHGSPQSRGLPELREMFPQSLGFIPKEFVNEYHGNDSLVFPPVDDGKQSHVLR